MDTVFHEAHCTCVGRHVLSSVPCMCYVDERINQSECDLCNNAEEIIPSVDLMMVLLVNLNKLRYKLPSHHQRITHIPVPNHRQDSDQKNLIIIKFR